MPDTRPGIGQGQGGNTPPEPTPPDPHGPPSNTTWGSGRSSQPATQVPAPSGVQQEVTVHPTPQENNMDRSSRIWSGLVGFIILALAVLLTQGLGCRGCSDWPVIGKGPITIGPDPSPRPWWAGGSGTASASTSPLPPGPPSMTLTEAESNATDRCNSAVVGRDAARWYAVYTALDSHTTLATRLCGSTRFRVAETARIVGHTVYIREGGHDASGNIDTGRKLSDLMPGKVYMTVWGSGDKSYIFSNPKIVYVDEGDHFDFCTQYKTPKPPAKDDYVAREIWSRCQQGGDQNIAVVKTIVDPANKSWFSKEDGTALAAKVHEIEKRVDAAGNQPVKLPPKKVGWTPPGD